MAAVNLPLAAINSIDELVKEYLLFRGFTQTIRILDTERKNDKLKGYQADKIIEQMFFFINNYDVVSLVELWNFLDLTFFSKLDSDFSLTIRKLEISLKRYYLIYATNSGRLDKVREFFEMYATELAKDAEWRGWFALPYLKNPQGDPSFELFFSKVWVETFSLSLHNFLVTIVKSVPLPKLLSFDNERQVRKRLEVQIDALKKENDNLKNQIVALEDYFIRKNPRDEFLEKEKRDRDQALEKERKKREKEEYDKDRERDKENDDELRDSDTKLWQSESKLGSGREVMIGRKRSTQSHPDDDPTLSPVSPFPYASPATTPISNKTKLSSANRSTPLFSSIATSIASNAPKLKPTGINLFGSVPSAPSTPASSGTPVKHALAESENGIHTSADAMLSPSRNSLHISAPGSLVTPQNPSKPARENSPLQGYPSPTSPTASSPTPATSPPTTPPPVFIPTPSMPSPAFIVGENDSQKFETVAQDTLWSHTAAVAKSRFSGLGSKMACSGVDGVVKIWSTDSTARITTIFCFAEVLSLEWETKTNKLLLCGTTDARVKVWNVFGDRDVGDIVTDQEFPRVEDLSCNPSGANFVAALSSARRDSGQLVLYNLKTFKVENKLTMSKTSTVTALSYNHNGSLVLAGSTDGMIRVFDMKTCAAIAGFQAHSHEVAAVQFSADETSIFSVGKDNKIMQWSMHQMGKVVREYSYPGFCRERPFLNGRIAFDSEGHHFVVPSLFNYAIIYHVDHPTPVSLVQGHTAPVIGVDWHPTTDTIITGSMDLSVKVTTLARR